MISWTRQGMLSAENPVTSLSNYLIWTARILVHVLCILIKYGIMVPRSKYSSFVWAGHGKFWFCSTRLWLVYIVSSKLDVLLHIQTFCEPNLNCYEIIYRSKLLHRDENWKACVTVTCSFSHLVIFKGSQYAMELNDLFLHYTKLYDYTKHWFSSEPWNLFPCIQLTWSQHWFDMIFLLSLELWFLYF